MYFIIIIYLISLRIAELLIAKSNEKHQKNQGAIEIDDPYYAHIVVTHILFFIALILESVLSHGWGKDISIVVFTVFLLLQAFRFWCLFSLGRFWNTKVIVLPNAKFVRKGPYKWINHPNYWLVGLELFVIPIMFHAYITAFLFVSAHIWLMTKRIPLENQALHQHLTK